MQNPYRKITADTRSRPFPEKMDIVPYYEKGKYDLAILHLDQQCFEERIGKGRLFREANKIIDDVPKVIINHMTPFDDRMSTPDVIAKCKELVGNIQMIVNSHEAKRQWGFGHTIIHGLTSDEWWDLPKEPRAVTVLSPSGMEKAYRRTFLIEVKRILGEMGINHIWIGGDKPFYKDFDEYRNFLGRSLIYFNPTWQSPMPRSRTEAMLSGCCVVTTRYHGAEEYFKNGVNGFLVGASRIDSPNMIENPHDTAKLIYDLIVNRYSEAVKIGQEGKKTAKEIFNSQNFEKQWHDLLLKMGIL